MATVELAIVYDSWTEGHAIYIDGILRGEWNENGLTPDEFFACYETYARGPVRIVSHEVNSQILDLFDEEFGVADWPNDLASLEV